jgi:hypothetical protein
VHEGLTIDPTNHVEQSDVACANCRWWQPPTGEVRPVQGQCFGVPPIVILAGVHDDGHPELVNARPATRRGDFCGMFVPRATPDFLNSLPQQARDAILKAAGLSGPDERTSHES